MKDIMEFSGRATRMWLDAWVSGAHAATTIACRLPMIAVDPFGAESRRMVSEKVVAAGSGSVAASAAMMKAAGGGAMGPVAAALATLDVAEAAARPMRRRVKANASRLSRKRKTRLGF